jgi:hypothetical protein
MEPLHDLVHPLFSSVDPAHSDALPPGLFIDNSAYILHVHILFHPLELGFGLPNASLAKRFSHELVQ